MWLGVGGSTHLFTFVWRWRWHCHHPNSNGWAPTSTPATCQPQTSAQQHSHAGPWLVLCETTTMRMPLQSCIDWHHCANTLAAVCVASHLSSTIAWWLVLLLQCNGFVGHVKTLKLLLLCPYCPLFLTQIQPWPWMTLLAPLQSKPKFVGVGHCFAWQGYLSLLAIDNCL